MLLHVYLVFLLVGYVAAGAFIIEGKNGETSPYPPNTTLTVIWAPPSDSIGAPMLADMWITSLNTEIAINIFCALFFRPRDCR
jgi:hypothetical protein